MEDGNETHEVAPGIKVGLFVGGISDLNYGERTVYVSVDGRMTRVDSPVDSRDFVAIDWRDVKHLTGKLLTLCDATFTDPTQRKAFKDRVKEDLRTWMERLVDDAEFGAYGPDHRSCHPIVNLED